MADANETLRNKILFGLNDADSPTAIDRLIPIEEPQYYKPESIRDNTTFDGRYDAVELAHGNNPYDMVGTDNKSKDQYGKSTYAMEMQRNQVAGLVGKNPNELTEQDMIDVGNQQQIQKLADIARSEGEDRWVAPLIRNAEQANLTGRYKDEFGKSVQIPLDIPISTQDTGKFDANGRALTSIVNPSTGENISDTAALDPTQNAFFQQATAKKQKLDERMAILTGIPLETPNTGSNEVGLNPEQVKMRNLINTAEAEAKSALFDREDLVDNRNIAQQAGGAVNALAAGLGTAVLDVADTAVEFAGDVAGRAVGVFNEDIGIAIDKAIDLGDEKSKRKLINNIVGYDDRYSKASMKELEGHVENAIKDVYLMKPSTWGNTDVGELWNAAKTALSDIETASYSLGYMVPAIAGVGSKGVMKVGSKALQDYSKTASAINKSTKISQAEKFGQMKELTDKLSKNDKVKLFIANNADAIGYGAMMNNNQMDEYIAQNGGEDATLLRALGGTIANAVGMKLDVGVINSIMKPGTSDIGSKAAQLFAGMDKNAASNIMAEVVKFGVRATSAGLKEMPQEWTQGFIEGFNKVYGTQERDENYNITGNTITAEQAAGPETRLQATIGSIAGLAGGAQTSAAFGAPSLAKTTIGATYDVAATGLDKLDEKSGKFNPERTIYSTENKRARQNLFTEPDSGLANIQGKEAKLAATKTIAQEGMLNVLNKDRFDNIKKISGDKNLKPSNIIKDTVRKMKVINGAKTKEFTDTYVVEMMDEFLRQKDSSVSDEDVIATFTNHLDKEDKSIVRKELVKRVKLGIAKLTPEFNKALNDIDVNIDKYTTEELVEKLAETKMSKEEYDKAKNYLEKMGSFMDKDSGSNDIKSLQSKLDEYLNSGVVKNSKDVRKEIFTTGFSELGKKSMDSHKDDILQAVANNRPYEEELASLKTFVASRGAIDKVFGADDTGKLVIKKGFEPGQTQRLISTIIDDNDRINNDYINKMRDVFEQEGKPELVKEMDTLYNSLEQSNTNAYKALKDNKLIKVDTIKERVKIDEGNVSESDINLEPDYESSFEINEDYIPYEESIANTTTGKKVTEQVNIKTKVEPEEIALKEDYYDSAEPKIIETKIEESEVKPKIEVVTDEKIEPEVEDTSLVEEKVDSTEIKDEIIDEIEVVSKEIIKEETTEIDNEEKDNQVTKIEPVENAIEHKELIEDITDETIEETISKEPENVAAKTHDEEIAEIEETYYFIDGNKKRYDDLKSSNKKLGKVTSDFITRYEDAVAKVEELDSTSKVLAELVNLEVVSAEINDIVKEFDNINDDVKYEESITKLDMLIELHKENLSRLKSDNSNINNSIKNNKIYIESTQVKLEKAGKVEKVAGNIDTEKLNFKNKIKLNRIYKSIVSSINKVKELIFKYHTLISLREDVKNTNLQKIKLEKESLSKIKEARKEIIGSKTAYDREQIMKDVGGQQVINELPENMKLLFKITGDLSKKSILDFDSEKSNESVHKFFTGITDPVGRNHPAWTYDETIGTGEFPVLKKMLPKIVYNKLFSNTGKPRTELEKKDVEKIVKSFNTLAIWNANTAGSVTTLVNSQTAIVYAPNANESKLTAEEIKTELKSFIDGDSVKIKTNDNGVVVNESKVPDGFIFNPLALVGSRIKENGTIVFSKKIIEAIRFEGINTLSDMINMRSMSKDDIEDFMKNAFGVIANDELVLTADIEDRLKNGEVPRSVFVYTAGSRVLKSLRLGLQDNVDIDIIRSIEVALGEMVIEGLKSGSTAVNSLADDNIKIKNNGRPIVQELRNKLEIGDQKYTMLRIDSATKNAEIDNSLALIQNAASIAQYIGYDGDNLNVQLEPLKKLEFGKAKVRKSDELMSEKAINYINQEQAKPLKFGSTFMQMKDILGLEPDKWYEVLLDNIDDMIEKGNTPNEIEEALLRIEAEKLEIDRMLFTYELVGDEEFYLKWDQTVSGRFMIDNSMLNPQNSKITRFLTTRPDTKNGKRGLITTIKRNKDGKLDSKNMHVLKAAMVQAFNTKGESVNELVVVENSGIDKLPDAVMIKAFEENHISISDKGEVKFINETLRKEYEDYKSLVQGNKDLKLDLKSHGTNERMHVMQAYNAILALENNTNSDVVHELVLESDGITNGMMLIAQQYGTDEAIELLGLGGVYAKNDDGSSSNFKTHGEYLAAGNVDIYMKPINKMVNVLSNRKIGEGENEKIISSNITTLIDKNIIKGNNNKWRKLLKPLVMVYIYGASIKSIGKKAGYIIGIEMIRSTQKDKTISDKTINELVDYAFPNIEKDANGKVTTYGKTVQNEKAISTERAFVRMLAKALDKVQNNGKANAFAKDANGKFKNPNPSELKTILYKGLKFKVVVDGKLVNSELDEEMIVKNMYIDSVLLKQIASDVSKVYSEPAYSKPGEINPSEVYSDPIGKAIKDSFGFIDDFRATLKYIELVNFGIFKMNFVKKLDTYKNKDGSIQINQTEMKKILDELRVDGKSYTAKNASGGNQDYTKTKSVTGDKEVAINGLMLDGGSSMPITKRSNAKTFEQVANVGATGVITIHDIDGFLMLLSTTDNIQNIYDAFILPADASVIDKNSGDYNKNMITTARTHSILGNALLKLRTSLARMDDNEIKELKKFMVSESELEDMMSSVVRIGPELIEKFDEVISKMDKQRAKNLGKAYRSHHMYSTDIAGGVDVEAGDVAAVDYNTDGISSLIKNIVGDLKDKIEEKKNKRSENKVNKAEEEAQSQYEIETKSEEKKVNEDTIMAEIKTQILLVNGIMDTIVGKNTNVNRILNDIKENIKGCSNGM